MAEVNKHEAWSRVLDCLDNEYKALLKDVKNFLQQNPLMGRDTEAQNIARISYRNLLEWENNAQQSIYQGWKEVEEIKNDLKKELIRFPHLQKSKALPFQESNIMSYALSSYQRALQGLFKGIILCAKAIRLSDSEKEQKWLNQLIEVIHENSRFKIHFLEIGQKVMPGEVHFLDAPNPETDWRVKKIDDRVKIVSAGKIWHLPTVSV